MLSFSLVAEALTGLIYHRPSGENSKIPSFLVLLFEILKQLQHTLAPTNLMVDFEIAVLNAIDTSFPGTNNKGCFFHFSQAIFRKIQSLGLQNRYKDDENFAHKVRMLAALAFVPLSDVIGCDLM